MNIPRTLSKSEALAGSCVGLTLDWVPAEVKQKAALCILDTAGCMIAGSRNVHKFG